MRRVATGLTALAVAVALTACSAAAGDQGTQQTRIGDQATPEQTRLDGPTTPLPTSQDGKTTAKQPQYLVFYDQGKQREALDAVTHAGGTVIAEDTKLGYLLTTGGGDKFAENTGGNPAVVGVSPDRRIGFASSVSGKAAFPDLQSFTKGGGSKEPLAGRQWDMRMIGADRANAVAPGTKKVLVGVIDTGIDGKHPDIAPNFNRELSRNFVTDKPKDEKGETLDGPCEAADCKDPVDEDDDGHGTHVASTIASPVNGIGIAGVAPNVQLVNIRAGQDSGFFFLKASLDALTYAADIGVDVVNMSYYVDPWLFNCAANPSDSKKQQLEQKAVIIGMQRALDYARARDVTIISALGNGSSDLGHPQVDKDSPGYPRGDEKTRKVDNSCINVPAESNGVISVSALGPSGRKAIYSDYGLEQTDVSAPGGDVLDGKGAAATRSILAAAPENVLKATGRLDASGKPKGADVVQDCHKGVCSYYQYLDGTSMASPHATGVAAILISRFGKPGKGGLTLAPATVENLLYKSATQRPCPTPRKYVYKVYGESEIQECEGDAEKNGFFGRGVVNAWKAATFEP